MKQFFKCQTSDVQLELQDNNFNQRFFMPSDDRVISSYYTLEEFSPKDAHFDNKKRLSLKTAKLLRFESETGYLGFINGKRFIRFTDISIKISACGGYLKFAVTNEGNKLIEANFCKNSMCPNCQERRALKWRAKFLTLMPQLQEAYPTHRWLFLTLTIRNCDINQLRSTIKHLNESFNRLVKLEKFPMLGLIKSIEVTRAWDCYYKEEYLGCHGTRWIVAWEKKNKKKLTLKPTNIVHPHLHICGLVAHGYFAGHSYLKHEQWVQMWKQSLRIDYEPIVNIKAVKPKQKELTLPTPEDFEKNPKLDTTGMIQAVCETVKYTVKEQDLIGVYCKDDAVNSEWLKALTEQLYKTRRIEYRGVLKELGKELDKALTDDNLIDIKDDKEEVKQEVEHTITFRWLSSLERYVMDSKDEL